MPTWISPLSARWEKEKAPVSMFLWSIPCCTILGFVLCLSLRCCMLFSPL
jgi:hypothetical protein